IPAVSSGTEVPAVPATATETPVPLSSQGTRSLDIPPLQDPYATAASASSQQNINPVTSTPALQATSSADVPSVTDTPAYGVAPQVVHSAETEFSAQLADTTAGFLEEAAVEPVSPARPKQPSMEPKLVISESTRFMARLNQRLSEADKKLSSRGEQIRDRLN